MTQTACDARYMQDNRRQCSWALSWDGYRAWVCEAVQTIAREQTSFMGAELWPALNSPTPFLGRPARYYMLLFWPGHLCVYLHDWETRASPVRTPPRILLPPLENLGLSCQGPATQTAPSDVHDLQDVVVGTELQRSDVDLDVLLQEVFCQLADLFGPTHVQHSVGLVQHEVSAAAEVCLSGLEEVDEPARNVKLCRILLPPVAPAGPAHVKSLARASLCNADHILSTESQRPALSLDGCGSVQPALLITSIT
ncbi:hypothetical protein F7725_003976 [Dissostichus mawsoni]|uniref:Uncharacterized protein n=1 Tax=Dissostichus mawsoni TaxID=36200 RepID=A0A7J5YF21_DISMA|nr:hypothetical protein F7725_003976 [Dissostichus mawsoni]